MTGSPQAIGVDVGGTKTAAMRVSGDGTVIAREVLPTPADDMAATLETIVAAAKTVATEEVAAAGIAAAGLVETATGILRFAPNLAWRDAPLVAFVSERLDVPVVADNDNTAAAWGEYRFGAGRGCRDLLLVGVGTGIGGGVVAGGELLRGAHGFAAEIGHIVVEPDGPRCGCGNRGCWEQVASGRAIGRLGRDVVAHDPHSLLATMVGGDPGKVTGEMVTEAAVRGDPVSVRILAEVGRRLGEGIAGLVNILDPDIVVVGGGAVHAGELLLGPAREVSQRAVEGPDHRPVVPLVPARMGNDAGAVGAALLALEELVGVGGGPT